MKRLYLTVEGQTDAAFATNVSCRIWRTSTSSVLATVHRPAPPPPWSDFPGRFCSNTFGHAFADMQTWLKEDQSADARFS